MAATSGAVGHRASRAGSCRADRTSGGATTTPPNPEGRPPGRPSMSSEALSLWPDDPALHHRVDRRVGGHVVDRDLEQRRRPAAATSVPWAKRGVAVAAGVHEVVRDEPHGVRRADRRRGARRVRWAPSRSRRRRASCRCSGTAPSARRPGGTGRCRSDGIAERREPVEERGLRSWAPVSVRMTVRLPKGSTREHLAPGDLARLLAGGVGGATSMSCRGGRRSSSRRRRRPGYLRAHRVRDEVAHRRFVEPGRVAQDVVGLGADDLVRAGRPSRRSRRRRSPGRPAAAATPMFLAIRVAPPAQVTSPPLTISWRTE